MKPTNQQIDKILSIIGKGFNLSVLDKSFEYFPRTITMEIISAWEELRGENE